MAMDKLHSMRAFVSIVEHGSLTAAADDLDTSLPSVVRMLASLERSLGVRLLNRTTRRIRLTDEGAQYLEHCRRILGEMRDFESGLTSRQSSPAGRLSVTASVLFGRRHVAPIVTRFIQHNPAVDAHLLLIDRVTNIVEEGIDVAVRIGHLQDSSLVAVKVGAVRRVVCASPAYLRERGVPRTPADVASHACVRHTGLSPRHEWPFAAGKRKIAVPIHPVVTCNDIDGAIHACVEGLGLGMFLSYQVAPYGKGQLQRVLREFETDPMPVNVIYAHTKLMSARVRAFVDECVTSLRQIDFD